MSFWNAIEVIGRTIWTVIETMFSLFPVYLQLNDFKTQIIASAIGVPVLVVTIVGLLIKVFKFGSKHLS